MLFLNLQLSMQDMFELIEAKKNLFNRRLNELSYFLGINELFKLIFKGF